MYESFFGLRERPFDLTPNPRFLLMTPTHKEALANLHYGMTARKGLTVLIGEAGAGKTTLIRTARAEWEKAGHLVAHLNNPTLTRDEFFETLAGLFELGAEAGSSKARFLAEFSALVARRHEAGQLTGLVIDEAQSLSDELLEEVRLLVNVESSQEKLFQVLLVGQPELAERLKQPGLRQIKQRIALRCTLSTLDVREAAAYVARRIEIAGGVASQAFTREAVLAIHRHSGGIPRVISVISDNALLAGFAADVRPVTSAMVDEVCREFDIEAKPAEAVGAFETVRPTVQPEAKTPAAAERPSIHEHPETARELEGRGIFQQYIAAGKRRFSFF